MKILNRPHSHNKITNDQLAQLYMFLKDNEDYTNAEKIIDLYEKYKKEQFYISFTGHFSAGKSSIINFLLSKDLLPKSPIPTSANVVKVTSGEGVARVYFHNENPEEYKEPYDIDLIKDFCMNKDTIREIEINTSEDIIPKGSFIVDTPGIDAADDTDRHITESSLHIVDHLYYVMDYNHVQSEINFMFLKEIQDRHIPIHIIINQIDKHNDNELTFQSFKDQVEESFSLWNIKPKNIYYTSMYDQSIENNDLFKLKEDLFSLLHEKNYMEKQNYLATKIILQEHDDFLKNKYDMNDYKNETTNLAPLTTELDKIQKKIIKKKHEIEQFEKDYIHDIEQTLRNAYVMPAQLRDLALSYLESQEKGFKVGFLLTKRRTEEEREKRQQQFIDKLQQSVQTTILWRLRDKFNQFAQQYDLHNDKIQAKIEQFHIEVSEKDIVSYLQEGAMVNGNYVLNYTNNLSNHFKQLSKEQAIDILQVMKTFYTDRTKRDIEQLEEQEQNLQIKLKHSNKNIQLQKSYEQSKTKIMKVINEATKDEKSKLLIENKIKTRYEFKQGRVENLHQNKAVPSTKKSIDRFPAGPIDESIQEKNTNKKALSADRMISAIDGISDIARNIEGFQSLIDDLTNKKANIENRSLTIALFGAFSAGKSSFSNALLGEAILPVSPNPTTAVINRISPINERYDHGDVVISFKQDAFIYDDIQNILKDYPNKATNLEELVQWIKEESIYEKDRLTNIYQTYLKAIVEGFEQNSEYLGTELIISLEEFSSYVTEESIAVFIECVDLYYENEITKKGITLVDTPGANSVNARHTNVAFDYIKEADAIIYVTYYNHAVTSADRDFLIQLGRVKESFQLDKMFFIINAADLAKDESELNLVVNYVEEQLLNYGIRNANIYPLSSKQSLNEKLHKKTLNPLMTRFESAFYSFIDEDLQRLTFEAALWDMKRMHTMLQSMIESAQLDENEKEKQIKQLETNNREAFDYLTKQSFLSYAKLKIEERIRRQLHFVIERLFIRFHDMFTQFFNPTTVTSNGREGHRQLEKNTAQLIDYIGYELLQEVRAVSLRLESFINNEFSQYYQEIVDELATINEQFILSSFEQLHFQTPQYEQAFLTVDVSDFKEALRHFKNVRSFFEQRERDQMRDQFEQSFKPLVEQYIKENELIVKEKYMEQLIDLSEEIKNKYINEISFITTQQINSFSHPLNINELQNNEKDVKNIIQNIER